MTLKKEQLFIAIALAISLLALVLSVTNFTKKKKLVYINNIEVYEGFKGKQILEHKLKQNLEGQKNFIDSLQLVISSLSPEDESFRRQVELYNNVNQTYNQNLEGQRNEYITQALSQINIYVEEYAKMNNYNFIIGNSGNGNVVYAKDELNKTKEVIAFVNQEYEKNN